MKTVKIEIELPEFEGFEYTGEFRIAKEGEYHLSACGSGIVESTSGFNRHILKKVEQWRDAKFPEDWGKEARFTDDKVEWLVSTLAGYDKYDKCDNWISGEPCPAHKHFHWDTCQVRVGS